MSRVDDVFDRVTEDRRAAYLFNTKTASDAVGCVPTKFSDWWLRTQRKLIALAEAEPHHTAAHFALILAKAAETTAETSASRKPGPDRITQHITQPPARPGERAPDARH